MAARVSSPRFVGRGAELARLQSLWKAAVAEDDAGAVLVSGEAGVGKSRLVAELGTHIGEPALVLTGYCIEVVDRALPFGPIVQVLRELQRVLNPATLDAVLGPALDELAALLPDLGANAGAGVDTTALFEQVLGVLERLGDRIPTLVVLEDLHWADRSTRDLFVFLARSLRSTRVLVVGTYRSDDLHRRHPLRSAVAELERSGTAERVDLGRFDRDEIRELVAAICGEEPAPGLVDETYERSDGNAFFAEELLASGAAQRGPLPDNLRDIVLARVDALPEPTRRVLRCAAVIGRTADHRLLAAITDMSDDALLDALRTAATEHVLVADADGRRYRFRHALVHEAVYDDLLPGDRVQLHARVAEQLGEHPEWFDLGAAAIAAELACHWDAAGNAPRALAAAMRAADTAEAMYAYSEGLAHVERVLALWPQVVDAEAVVGMRHVDVVRRAAGLADLSGNVERALDFVQSGLAEVDAATDPTTAGMLHDRVARYLWMLSRPWRDVLAHCDEAVRLVPDAPTAERARVLATQGQHLMLVGRNRDAIRVCEAAIRVAQLAGERVVEGHARNSLGSALGACGRADEGIEQLHLARAIAIETRAWSDLARAAVNESSALQILAREEEALTIALEGAQLAHAHGLDRSCGAFLRLNAIESMWRLGRWDDVEEQLREVEAIDASGIEAWRFAENRALLAAARGAFADARNHAARMAALLGTRRDTREQLAVERVEVVMALWDGDAPAAARRALEAAEAPIEDPTLCSDVGTELLVEGSAAAADAAVRARARDDRSEADVHARAATRMPEILAVWIGDNRWDGGRPGSLGALTTHLHAEAARAAGAIDAAGWQRVEDEWSALGMAPRAAYAAWRTAEAFVHAGDRNAATDAARRAYTTASALQWSWVRDGVAALARRARLDVEIDQTTPTAAERLGLTPRELEVLSLVGDGFTNRRIAEALFISPKTASVHVSNILAKLGVTNRGEAVAAARRLGLDQAAARS